MIKNIIFDFDGVIVDSEVLVARSLKNYLSKMNIKFKEKDFFELAGNKTVQVIEMLSSRYNIKEKNKFFDDIMKESKELYSNDLQLVDGVKNFLNETNHKRIIGSNNTKERIVESLNKIELIKFFDKNLIFTFEQCLPKPNPDIYLRAVEYSNIIKEETIIIEDSVVGTLAGVKAGIKVIGLTAGGHWHKERPIEELYEAGAFKVVKDYEEMLLLINNL